MRLFMKHRITDPVPVAAARAGFSTATGYRMAQDPRPPSARRPPRERRRPDPLAEVFDADVVPMLTANPGLRPVAILEELLRRHPDLGAGIRRTLERRIRQWRALHGAEREVIFREVHEPGRMGLSDFTDMSGLGVTVAKAPLPHRLHHFRLAFSGFEHGHVVLQGESFVALAVGLQDALWTLGGVPAEHRTDSLSAAFRNLAPEAAKDWTARYEGLCGHYGMVASRDNRGVAHENGAIEGPHGHLERAVEDALWLARLARLRHRRRVPRLHRRAGRPPQRPQPQAHRRRARRAAAAARPAGRRRRGFEPGRRRRSIDPVDRSKGEKARRADGHGHVVGRVHAEECVLHRALAPHRPPIAGAAPRRPDRGLPGRHASDDPAARSRLRRRPPWPCRRLPARHPRTQGQAFRRRRTSGSTALPGLVYRDQLFARDAYRRLYEAAMEALPERAACKLVVGALAIAHERGCEADLAALIDANLDAGAIPVLADLRARFAPDPEALPQVTVTMAPLSDYDVLTAAPAEEGAPA
jgi:hypothetical protein